MENKFDSAAASTVVEKEEPAYLVALRDKWSIGSIDDAQHVYVGCTTDTDVLLSSGGVEQAVLDTTYVPTALADLKRYERVTALTMLYVPETMRKQGVATRIVRHLRQRSNAELGQRLFVGPITDETGAMQRVCEQLGFKPIMPFGFLQPRISG